MEDERTSNLLVMNYGVWERWGFEISYCPITTTFSLAFIKWWVEIEWSK